MHEYSVSLRISGRELVPAEVTGIIGMTATQVRFAGKPRSSNSVWDESMWGYEIKKNGDALWASLEEGLTKLILTFQPHIQTLRRYQTEFEVVLWCGHFSSSFDGGPKFSPALLRQLADFGVELYLDTYFCEASDK